MRTWCPPARRGCTSRPHWRSVPCSLAARRKRRGFATPRTYRPRLVPCAAIARAANDRRRVEDETHAPIGELRRARDAWHRDERVGDGMDHDLAQSDDPVDDQAGEIRVRPDDEHMPGNAGG